MFWVNIRRTGGKYQILFKNSTGKRRRSVIQLAQKNCFVAVKLNDFEDTGTSFEN